MNITSEINDYSKPAKPHIRIHNSWPDGNKVDLEIDGKRYTVSGSELISAVKRCMLNTFGE